MEKVISGGRLVKGMSFGENFRVSIASDAFFAVTDS